MIPESWRSAYLHRILQEPHAPPFYADIRREQNPLQTNMEWFNVFIPLATSTPDKSKIAKDSLRAIRDNPTLSVHKALFQEPFNILCGASGAGKSTILHTYTLFLTGECLELPDFNLSLPQTRTSFEIRNHEMYADRESLLPVYLDLTRQLDMGSSGKLGENVTILQCFEQYLSGLGFRDQIPDFNHEMEEKGIQFFLDNTDPFSAVKDENYERWITEAHELRHRYPKVRITLAVEGERSLWEKRIDIPPFAIYEIALLNRAQIDLLSRRWFENFAGNAVDSIEHSLESLSAWLDADESHVSLIQKPLMLTLLLYVQTVEGSYFPQTCEDLLSRAVEALARRWLIPRLAKTEGTSLIRNGIRTGDKPITSGRFLESLGRIITERKMAAPSSHRLVSFSHDDILSIWRSSHDHPEVAETYSKQRVVLGSGLFTSVGNGLYTLPHTIVQLFLHASYLAQHDFPAKLVKYFSKNTRDHQDILLIAAKLTFRENPVQITELIDRLHENNSKRDPWVGYAVANILAATGVESNDIDVGILAHAQNDMVEFISNTELPISARASAGLALAKLGDPRFRSDAWYLPDDPMLGFIEIPAGSFIMGTREEVITSLIDEFGVGSDWEGQTLGAMLSEEPNIEELIREMGLGDGWEELDSKVLMRQWYRREIPQHELELSAYYIARFPVTNAQFGAFIKESGHKPEVPDGYHGISNHPLAHVTWLDSTRYCCWLTEILRSWKDTPDVLSAFIEQGWHVALPSEAEWEKAARGPTGSTLCTRTYPWGDVFDPNRANSKEAGLATTSTVGCFSQGASPYGVLDMAGNVWEWTRSLWGEDEYIVRHPYPYQPLDGREGRLEGLMDQLRVLRGGSYKNYRRYIRCTTRRSPLPVLPSSIRGFRLVLTPSSPI